MRIAMVSEHASPLAVLGGVDAGGQNVHVAALAEALARRGHLIEVYTRRDDPDLPERTALCPGVDVVHVDAGPARPVGKDMMSPFMPAFGRDLARRWCVEQPPDVVHAHFWMSGSAVLTATETVAVPVLQTFHALGTVKRRYQGAADASPRGRLRAEARLVRQVDRVVATCADEVRELVAMGADPDRVDVVPCGVDTEHFRPDGGSWPAQRPRLVAVGRLVERKGVDTVVRALAVLPGVELVVAGGPDAADLGTDPEARRLLALAGDLGVTERVRLAGRVDHAELPALLRSADVVVATPWYEPFGIVPLEAAACGRPLVGSAVGGLLDTVDHGSTGLLVPPQDPAAVAAAVGGLLDDPSRRRAVGAAARQRAVRRYGWDRVAAATERVYRDVVAGREAGAPLPVAAGGTR